MSQPFDRRLAENPPVRPERVMPAIAAAVTAIAVALVLVGLVTLWPVVAGAIPASASALALSTVVFGALLVAIVVTIGRVSPETPR